MEIDPDTTQALSPVDWHSYAECYDLLCDLNPAYASLIGDFSNFLKNRAFAENATILDLGGGTGNFLAHGLTKELSRANLLHLDSNAAMLEHARQKYTSRGLKVELVHADAAEHVFEPRSLDCVLTVNALYAMRQPERILKSVYQALKPGGYLFFVNLGRIQNTLDWTMYLLARNFLRLGPRRLISILRNEGAVIAKANRAIAQAQRQQQYWRHTTIEIGEYLAGLGFQIEDLRPCYRGYSDLAVCTKPNRAIELSHVASLSRSHTFAFSSELPTPV